MQYYLAPMEGLTTYVFRQAFHRYYGGCDRYFTPFLSNKKLSSKEVRELSPEHNLGMDVVPQILTNKAEDFLALAHIAADYGYNTVNLNLGCPSGTVTAKKRGAGFLSIPDQLDAFLDEIFTKSPVKISIKTRIGISEESEWDRLLSIFANYPAEELIIHPRLQTEYYKGIPHLSAYQKAVSKLKLPLCYNGDIVSEETEYALLQAVPDTKRIMIGRGIMADPALLCRLRHLPVPDKTVLRSFHDMIYDGYREWMSGELPVLFKMKELWSYLGTSFPGCDKQLKKLKKAAHFSEYEAVVNLLFQS